MLIIYGTIMAIVIYVAANYVLPVNKDTPGSDELFDRVILQELIPSLQASLVKISNALDSFIRLCLLSLTEKRLSGIWMR